MSGLDGLGWPNPEDEPKFMKFSEQIQVNDLVCVNFNGSCYTLCSRATVLHMPSCGGDSWGFRDEDSGQIHYVSEGCTVTLIEKAK